MESSVVTKHEKSGTDVHFNVAPAPAGGTEFDFDRGSPESTSSSGHSVSTEAMDDTSSFHTVKEFDSAASFGKSRTDEDESSSSDEMASSDVENSCVENSDNDEEETTKSSPILPKSGDSNAVASSSKNLVDESEIIQTLEDLDTKAEADRAKRFEFLLNKTEIWSHFFKPAYQEALGFGNNGKDKGTSNGLPDSESSTAGSSQASTSKGKGSKRGRKKAPLFPLPDMTNVKNDLDDEQPKYITRFEDSPSFIQGGTMRDYQVRGLNWMISLYEKGLSGILADEMGLGKTIQTISLLGYLKHFRNIKGPHLIIAPKSTLPNWMNELKRWCPTLKSICLIGTKEERPSLIKNTFLPKRWNVCVTSYEMARIEKSTLAKVNYHYIVIDEAQKIKNENSLLSTCVRKFHSAVRLLLTGTPLQNNLHELWALLNFLLPDVFSSSEDFDSWFNETNCIGNQTLVDRLHGILRPFLLRRIKSDVEKSLLPKTEMRLYVQMTPMQREWYRKLLLNDLQVVNSETGRVTKRALQNIIMHLRKCCNHPYLFEGAEPKPFTTDSHLITNSGKMIVLDKLLLKLRAQNSRVLLFSQMTRMLDILEDYCIWRNFEYCRLDGSTDYDIRQEDIDAFNAPNSSKFIYLISTRAGGLGINLASANIVIIYDSDWNPQMDLQAMDRAHRIGQTKQVQVFRFVVQETAEEKIIERAAAKLHLDRMVIQQGRLVGADANKGPNVVEMLSVVRFGAEKILKAGKGEGISDADIDTILAQSKIRSDEMDRRLNGLNEDNLRDLTIEQVELNYENRPVARDDNYTFNFEGQNYRELRKRKTISQDISATLMDGKRRKGSHQTHSDDDDLNEKDDASDSIFFPGDNDDESVSSFGENEIKDVKNIQNVKKPTQPLDFQFRPPYIWELYWRQVDIYQRKYGQGEVIQFPEDLLLQDVVLLKTAEGARLQKCNDLNSFELRELKMVEGFSSWKSMHFNQFLNAMKKHGPDDLENVAKYISRKEVEEVVQYSQVFWMKCHELGNFEQLMRELDRPSLITDRRKHQQKILDDKIMNAATPSEVSVQYDPQHWIGQRFTKEDDVQLLLNISEIGMLTPDVFDVLRSKLIGSRNGVSAFLRTRSKEELRTRFNLLIYMIEKELMTGKIGTPSTPIGSSSKANTPRTYARAKKTMTSQLIQKTSIASPKTPKSGTLRKIKTLQIVDSKAAD